VLVAAAAATPLVLLTPALTLAAASSANLTAAGTALPIDLPAAAALLGLALVAVLARGGSRAPHRRMALTALLAATGCAALLAGYQLAVAGETSYYAEKALHAALVVALVALGGFARLVPIGGSRLRTVAPAVAVAVVVTLGLAAAGGRWHTHPGSVGLRFLAGALPGAPDGGRDAVVLSRRFPNGGGAVTVDLTGTPYGNWFGTYAGSVLQRKYRYGHAWYGFLNPLGPPKTLADLEAFVAASPVPVRLVVSDPDARMLVLDPARPVRESDGPGADPAAWGDPGALTNVAAAEYLAERYPDLVKVVHLDPSGR
jgi:hypothetical protein